MAKGRISPAVVTDTWDAVCAAFDVGVAFTTADAVRKVMRMDGLTYNQARNRVDLALKAVLAEGSPDLMRREDKRWVLLPGTDATITEGV